MKRFTNKPDRKSPVIAARVRFFFDRTFRNFVEKGIGGVVIMTLIADPELAAVIEDLGEDGHLDHYLPVGWDRIAGIDIKYSGMEHGLKCHRFVIEVNGAEHDRFEYPFATLADALRN